MGQLIQFPAVRPVRETSRRLAVDPQLVALSALRREELKTTAGYSIPVFHVTKCAFTMLASVADGQPWSEANAAGTGTQTP